MPNLEKFIKHVEQQCNLLYQQQHGINEIDHITKLLTLVGASEFIEYGTWAGLVPKMILEKNPQLTTFIGIDAVPLYLELSKKFVTDTRYTTIPALIYNDLTIPYLETFYVGFDNSIDTSSIFTNRTERKHTQVIAVPTAQPYHARNFLTKRFPKLLNDASYVMMDLDGIDLTLIDCYLDQMLLTGIRPKVLQFEIWESCFQYWPDVKEKLLLCGYTVSNDLIDTNKGLATIAVANKHWWSYQTSKKDTTPITHVWKHSW